MDPRSTPVPSFGTTVPPTFSFANAVPKIPSKPFQLPLPRAVSPVLPKVTLPVLETIATENAPSLDFQVTAAFKLSNIKQYFEDDPAIAPLTAQKTPFFGPQIRLLIRRSTSPKKGIAVFLDLGNSNTLLRPMYIRFSLDFSADSKAKDVYCTLSFSRPISEEAQWGWEEALSTQVWETEESLRCANAVYIIVKVVGSLSQTPTSRAPPVLDLLHETIVEAPRSVVRFTVFDRRHAVDKKLTNRRVLSANREIIKDTCGVLRNILSRKTQWNGLLLSDAPEYDPSDSEIPDSDSDLEDFEDGPSNVAPSSTDPLSSEDCRESDQTSHGFHLSQDTIHAGGDDSAETASAEQDSQNVSESVVGIGDVTTDDKMQIDSIDTPVMKGQATQTDPQQLISDSKAFNVVIVGAAAITWEAFLFYLYTGIIEFAPLSSRGRAERTAYIRNFKADQRPKPCSPKSIYRIADIMKQEPLKLLALERIIEELHVDNILPELFSLFTSEHVEVEEQELQFFTQHCVEIMDSQAFKNLMVDVATGTYPHAGKLLGKVFQKVKEALTAKDDGPKAN